MQRTVTWFLRRPRNLGLQVPLPSQARVARRSIHLAPPFLLDDYTPRYMTLSSVDAAKKRSKAYAHLRNCNLCPRLCGVNRYETTGMCLIGDKVKVNVIAPHFGEEPCVQGHHGSGSVFFSMCNLRCVFCQNHDIAHQRNGQDLTPEELGDWYVKDEKVPFCCLTGQGESGRSRDTVSRPNCCPNPELTRCRAGTSSCRTLATSTISTSSPLNSKWPMLTAIGWRCFDRVSMTVSFPRLL